MTVRKQRLQHKGFTYIEVLLAVFILVVAIVPAMEALQTGIQGAGIHQSLTQQHYAVTKRMETVMAEPFNALLSAAQAAANASTPTSYSDLAGSTDRVVVFTALYDADADPFTLVDPNNDSDNDIYTGDTSNLLWLRVDIENTAVSVESLITQ